MEHFEMSRTINSVISWKSKSLWDKIFKLPAASNNRLHEKLEYSNIRKSLVKFDENCIKTVSIF